MFDVQPLALVLPVGFCKMFVWVSASITPGGSGRVDELESVKVNGYDCRSRHRVRFDGFFGLV